MNNIINGDEPNNEGKCGENIYSILSYLRAKSKENENYLLRDHLKETIKRAVELKIFINKNREAIDYNKFNDEFFQDLIVASFLHDLGKINFGFQKEVFKRNEMESNEYEEIKKFFDGLYKININDHEILSLIYSLIFNYDEERMKKIRTAILLHHYNDFYVNIEINIRNILDSYPDIEKYIGVLVKKKKEIICLLKKMLDDIYNEIKSSYPTEEKILEILLNLRNNLNFNNVEDFLKCINDGYGTSKKLPLFVPQNKEEKNYDFFVFLGSLRRCDYSASGSVDIEKSDDLSNIFNSLEIKIKNKIQKRDIWQEMVLLNINQPKNIVLIAPTGSGKTEFALLWAKKMGKKLVYTLPLRVALNDLYERFSTTTQNAYFNREDLRILHSTSFIEYLKDKKGLSKININVDEMQITSKLFSSPLILTTPDQVFLSSLKYYGFDKLISIYPLSAVVIDEIQAYNPEMAAVIIKTLDIIKQLNGNVLVMTATFPPYFSEFINKSNGFEKIDLKDNSNDVKNYSLKRHKIELLEDSMFSINENKNKKQEQISTYKLNDESKEKIKDIVCNSRNHNKNILIIVNNVGKAIALFKELENDEKFKECKERIVIKDNNIEIPLLLHSRLIEKEKSKRIEKIKNAINSGKKIILVSTQIVEASVDIDFDLLITEVSPIDSQIQRWGRIYRNRINDYMEKDPNIFIFTKNDKGTNAIYDEMVIEKTLNRLKDQKYKNVLNYEDERELIETVYEEKHDNKTIKQIYIDKIKENLDWLNYYSAEKRSEAQRIFRRINDIKVVFPDLMKKSEDIAVKELGEILEKNENMNLAWNEIEKKLSQKKSRWELIEIMYEYSCNIPFFSFEKLFSFEKATNYFKTFFIWPVKEKDVDVNNIQKYGIDKISKYDIDRMEIDENIII
ncbi:MAG: CRISPR-associated helicase Cas3' [Thermoplasmata archaeon]